MTEISIAYCSSQAPMMSAARESAEEQQRDRSHQLELDHYEPIYPWITGLGAPAFSSSPNASDSPAEQKESGAQFAGVADCGDAGAGEALKAVAGR